MDIITLLEKLLLKYDCVILPGFGAFHTGEKEAEIHPIKHSFIPPYKEISLNYNVKVNDWLLISELAYSEKINFEKAKEKIDSFVVTLENTLIKYKKYKMGKLGSIIISEKGELEIVDTDKKYFSNEYYGLVNFDASVINRREKSVTVEIKPPVMTVSKEIKEKNTSGRAFLKIAAVVFPILLIAGFGIWKFDNISSYVSESGFFSFLEKDNKEKNIAVVETEEPETAVVEPEIEIVEEPVVIDTIVETEIEEIVENITPEFYIIANSFSVEQNAYNYVETLKSEGYTNAVVVNKTAYEALYKVSYGEYFSQEEATQALNSIHITNPYAWLLPYGVNQ